MYKIFDNLATSGITNSPKTVQQTNFEMHYVNQRVGYIDGFRIVDVRMLKDSQFNTSAEYLLNIARVTSWLECDEKVVICSSMGNNRCNAIAVGVLVKYFKMDFYEALKMVHEKVPICSIRDYHISTLKKLFKVH